MIGKIKDSLKVVEIEDINFFNLMILKGVFKIPRDRADMKIQWRIKKQLKFMANGNK
jgi:hypothetical protein